MLVSTTVLTGCQLALDTMETTKKEDNICGVFVTLGDTRTLFNKNIGVNTEVKLKRNGKLSLEDIVFASEQESKIEGTVSENGNVSFDLEGYFIGFHKIIGPDGSPCNSIVGGEGLDDVKFNVGVTDTEEAFSCEATLYVSTEFSDTFYLNPVYQTKDESYYILFNQATGCSFSGEISGGTCSQSLDYTTTVTSGDKTKTEKRSFLIQVAVVDVIEQIFIKEMNQYDELIKATKYSPTDAEEFIVAPDTKYVIVEEFLANNIKGTYAKRSVYTPLPKASEEATNSHCCNFPGPKGRIDQKCVKFLFN